MEPIEWIIENFFVFLQSIGIVGSLIFTGWSLRIDAKVRRIQNIISATGQHRELWEQLYKKPELSRINESNVDLDQDPVTDDEARFVVFAILHLGAMLAVLEAGMIPKPRGIEKDVITFFELPIPLSVLRNKQEYIDHGLLRLVEPLLYAEKPVSSR